MVDTVASSTPQPQTPPTSFRRSPPPAAGVRIEWSGVPAPLRAAIESALGSAVVTATTQSGGFSPGAAARLALADGGRAFVKAVGPELNPLSPSIHRAEIAIASALPTTIPAPRLLASFDRPEDDGWVALVFEEVDGRMPAQPWIPAELDRVLDAITGLAAAGEATAVEAPPAAEAMADNFGHWTDIEAARDAGDDLTWLDPWTRANVDRLMELAGAWPDAVRGTSLVHRDLRADNMLLTDDGVVFVDWPWAVVGAPWLDLAVMLPSIAMQGGPSPESIVASHPLLKAADPDAVTAVATAVTAYFLTQSRLPPPPGLPTVRPFQKAQGDAAVAWLQDRIG